MTAPLNGPPNGWRRAAVQPYSEAEFLDGLPLGALARALPGFDRTSREVARLLVGGPYDHDFPLALPINMAAAPIICCRAGNGSFTVADARCAGSAGLSYADESASSRSAFLGALHPSIGGLRHQATCSIMRPWAPAS